MTKSKLSEHDADNKNLDSPVNIVSDKIGLKRFANTGRGVVAKTDINMNETILQIHNLITPLIATESDSELVDMLENSPDSSIDIQDLMTLWMISLGSESPLSSSRYFLLHFVKFMSNPYAKSK